VTALGAGRPSVAKILDPDIACRHANLGREVRYALLNPGQAFCLVESLEHLMSGVLTAALDDVAQQAEPTVLQLEWFVLLGHQIQTVATSQIKEGFAADPFARDAGGVEITPFCQIAVNPHPLG